MTYRAIGVMSGSSLDGLDIAFAEFQSTGGKWSYEIVAADCYAYDAQLKARLQDATSLAALEYQLLHTEYGHYIGREVSRFIHEKNLDFRVALIGSHGHTTFHMPMQGMTGQIGDGAAIAAETKLPVVSDLRALDVAFGGQGAPIVPVGEKLLLSEYTMFLNIGGIANISFNLPDRYVAFDVCPANRVLNMVAGKLGKEFDAGGGLARSGQVHQELLNQLNSLDYYSQSFPKSLANNFGTDVVYPFVQRFSLSSEDELRTYVEHIAQQVKRSIETVGTTVNMDFTDRKLLVTGGGAFNTFLMERLSAALNPLHIEVVVPAADLVMYKEALIMAFIAVLRWRQEYNVFASVTGAERNSINGALWIGSEA